MSFPSRLPPLKDKWYTDWDPSKRPIQLPLPKLDYDSDVEVWEWKFKNLLKHNSLLGFIESPGPPATPEPKTSEERLEIAAATHCRVLLGSCISEHILADMLAMSDDNKLHDDPCLLFGKAKIHATIFRSVCCDDLKGHPEIWHLFTGRVTLDSTPAVRQFLHRLGDTYKMSGDGSRRNVIVVAMLVVKRSCPLLPVEIPRKYVQFTKDKQAEVDRPLWTKMTAELLKALGD